MNKKIVTRFAPSPTGFLHVGGARTALYNFLLSKKQGGEFRLRIEDTDRERSSEKMTHQIFEGLKWLDMEWQKEVVYQGANAERHGKLAFQLVEKNPAYRCFCTEDELAARRKEKGSEKSEYKYDGTCRKLSTEQVQKNLDAGKPFAIRFKVPAGNTSWQDGIHGNITVQNSELEDFIILRSNGSPTYQLAVVVDDHDMEISDVIRGDDHISNTPKQILLYRAFEWDVPRFAHLPLILGSDKKRLSKRHGATSVREYRDMGILPETLFNFLTILGWTPDNPDQEILSKSEILQQFSLKGVSKKSAVFDEQKLFWMNGQYISNKPAQELFEPVTEQWQNAGFLKDSEINSQKTRLLEIIELHKIRANLLTDFVEPCRFYFEDPASFDEKGIRKHLKNPGVWEWLELCSERLQTMNNFEPDVLEQSIRNLAEELNISAAKLIHPVRLALTGKTASPGLFEVMALLGKETTLRRIKNFIDQKASLQPDAQFNRSQE